MTDSTIAPRARRYRGVDDDQRRAERRRRLVDAGLEVFGTEGYQSATVRMICAAAGLTERYFYESFANREELLAATYAHLVETLRTATYGALEAAGAGTEARASAVLEAYFAYIEANGPHGRVLLFEILGVSPAIDKTYIAGMDELARLLARVAGRDDADPLFGLALAGSVVAVAHDWVLSGYRRPRAEIVAHLAAQIVRFAA
jgi:AcrR family transcriptional regulator